MKIKYALLLILLMLTSCVSIKPIPSIYEKSDTFKIGEIQEKMVGEEMLVRQDIVGLPAFIIQYDYQPPSEMGVVFPLIQKGKVWAAIGTIESGDFVCLCDPTNRAIGNYYPTILGDPAFDKPWYLVVRKDNSAHGIMTLAGYLYKWPESQKDFVKSTIWTSKGSFKEAFIYNGKSQNTIKIQYREFNDDLARPAFFQDLSYDLSESKTVGFKGMSIDVLEATNSKIRFIVKTGMAK